MRFSLLVSFLIIYSSTFSQKLESGPMLGYIEHREALIWIAVDSSVKDASIIYHKTLSPSDKKIITKKINNTSLHNPVSFILPELEMNTKYSYEIKLNGKIIPAQFHQTFQTKELWEWRKPAPDFSFLIGSCAYRNDSLYDRPGRKYGQSPKIFETMGEVDADFNIWGGDNVYLRESDYTSESGMLYRYAKDRKMSEHGKMLASRPNYAVWDDHDYGPNDANISFELKDYSRELFTTWWGNRTYGEDGEGIYSKFSWSDCDFFLLDDRWFRSANTIADSIEGKPNPNKKMFGDKQMTWFKNAIATSRATFKFIVVGGQMLNTINPYECFYDFPAEYYDLLNFIEQNKIEGLVFLSGDRHLTEMIKIERMNAYPLYDFTCSAISSGSFKLSEKDKEFINPNRVSGSLITENNFSKITVSGEKKSRILNIDVIDSDGKSLWKYSIPASDLRYKK